MTMTSTTLKRRDDVFSDPELRTLAVFLGGYSGLTRDAYSLDLRQFVQCTQIRHVALFDVARADIEGFAQALPDDAWRSDRPRHSHVGNHDGM